MKKNNAEVLKKHHFWILAGLAPLFVLIAVIVLGTSVSGAIAKKAADNKAALDKVNAARPPGKGKLADLDSQKEVLGKKKGELWKENWDQQKQFFTWPKPPAGQFDKYAELKFGAPLKETSNEFEVFKRPNVYLRAYELSAPVIAPTKYAGGWQSVLRYVTDWGPANPKSEQIWTSLEDLWVQRAMLDPIRQVNEAVSKFEIVGDPKASPMKRTFRSRVWEVSLEVIDVADGKKALAGKLKNRTPQLQLLGLGNTLKLNVYLDPRPGVAPVPFAVEGEFVPGGEEMKVTPLPSHVLPPGVTAVEIAKVEPVLDERSVPVRRLDQLVLGFRSARHASAELKQAALWPDDAAATTTNPTSPVPPTTGDTGSNDNTGSPMGDYTSARGGGGGRGETPGGSGTASVGSQAGPPGAVLNGNKKRYIEVNEQLRRMPVAIVVVVDQMFVQDVLIAYANSPFRFQTVQSHWRRFRGSLGSTTATGSGGGTGGSPYDRGDSGSDDGIEGTFGEGLAGGTLGGPGGPGGRGSPYSPGGSVSNLTEQQANAGLVELTLYGLITLYEKLEVKKDVPAADGDKPADPMPPADGKPAETAKPATDGQPAVAKPAEPMKPAEPVKPADAKPAEPMKPADGKAADPMKPAEPAKPAEPPKM